MPARDPMSSGTRRRFLLTTFAAGLGASLPAPLLAQARRSSAKRRAPKPPPPAPTAPGGAPPSEDAKALAALLGRRYPHLDATRLSGITRELDQRLEGGRRLRASKLANDVEPDTTFRA